MASSFSWESGGASGAPPTPSCILAQNVLYYFRVGRSLDRASVGGSQDLYPLLHLLFLEIKSVHWGRAKLGRLIEARFLLFHQGDMVNYDDIKRFIRQEIIKMFDGNWQPAGWQWVMFALTSHFSTRSCLPFP